MKDLSREHGLSSARQASVLRHERSQTPDRISHLLRSVELGALLFRSAKTTDADVLIREYQELTGASIDESTVKRCLATLRQITGRRLFVSRRGHGRALSEESRESPEWLLPLLTEYLALNGVQSFHPALEAVIHRLGPEALYAVTLARVARDSGRPLRFAYARSGSRRTEERRVIVTDLAVRETRLIIVGRDLNRRARRQFLLLRMRPPFAVEAESPELPISRARTTHSLFHHSLGLFLGGEPRPVVVRFTGKVIPDIEREFFHSTQQLSERDGDVWLEMRVNNAQEVFAVLARYLGSAELCEPVEWRAEYQRLLAATVALHTKAGRGHAQRRARNTHAVAKQPARQGEKKRSK